MALEPIKALRSIPLFSKFDLQVLSEIKSYLIRKVYQKNEIVFHEQDAGSEMYIVRSGQVKIVSSGSEGREIILALFTPGQFFGELSLFDSQPRSARAVAAEKPTELLVLKRIDFMHLLEKHPSLVQEVFAVLAQRLRKADQSIQDLIFTDVKKRLIKVLISLAEEKGVEKNKVYQVKMSLTHKDLAEMIGSTRETVSRILQDLFDEKLLSMDRKELSFPNLARLKKLI